MKPTLFAASLIAGLVLSACIKQGTPVQTTGSVDKDGFNVEFLFESNGCKVYRFEDIGRTHYFTNCGQTITTQSEGKGNTSEEVIGETNDPR